MGLAFAVINPACKSTKKLEVSTTELQTGMWQLNKLFDSETNADDHMKGLPYIRFEAGNAVSGSTGCNQFSGTYELEDAKLLFERGPMTKMACPGENEALFINALSKVVRADINDGRLELIDEGGNTLMEFVRKEERIEN